MRRYLLRHLETSLAAKEKESRSIGSAASFSGSGGGGGRNRHGKAFSSNNGKSRRSAERSASRDGVREGGGNEVGDIISRNKLAKNTLDSSQDTPPYPFADADEASIGDSVSNRYVRVYTEERKEDIKKIILFFLQQKAIDCQRRQHWPHLPPLRAILFGVLLTLDSHE